MKALSALDNAIQATEQAYRDVSGTPYSVDKAEAVACIAMAQMSLEKAQRLLAGE